GVWVPALAAGISFAATQFLVATFMGPQLSALLAAVTSIGVLVALLRLRRGDASSQVKWSAHHAETTPPSARGLTAFRNGTTGSPATQTALAAEPAHSFGEIGYAWSPYILLVLCVCLWGFGPIQRVMNLAKVNVAWPMLDGIVQRMPPVTIAPAPYHAVFTFNFVSAAGTACMVATFLSALVLRLSLVRFVKLIGSVAKQLAIPILTIFLVLGIGFVMNYCGATATLGLAFASTGKLFPLFSPMLGLIGVFLTGSDTSANALFGNLQVVTAGRLGLDPVLMAAANAAGGVMGKMISVQTIAVAAAATGLPVIEQARLFRFTLKHSLLLGGIIGCLTLLYVYGLHL
ncbi:MAG: L-lactate permease, partial [Acidobacteriota bacterium]